MAPASLVPELRAAGAAGTEGVAGGAVKGAWPGQAGSCTVRGWTAMLLLPDVAKPPHSPAAHPGGSGTGLQQLPSQSTAWLASIRSVTAAFAKPRLAGIAKVCDSCPCKAPPSWHDRVLECAPFMRPVSCRSGAGPQLAGCLWFRQDCCCARPQLRLWQGAKCRPAGTGQHGAMCKLCTDGNHARPFRFCKTSAALAPCSG